jgi:hypothetical protein
MISKQTFNDWLTARDLEPAVTCVLEERQGARAGVFNDISESVADHLYGAELLARLGFTRSANVVREALPTSKKIRSGDLAEIMATEYLIHNTEFTVPVKRLRYKDDRDMSMRGDDLIAVKTDEQPARILKGEVKSRARLSDSVLGEACEALERYDNRPKPATLSFLARRLRETMRDEEAELLESFQSNPVAHDRITHLIFVMSGNDPETLLVARAGSKPPISDRRFVGLCIPDHQTFISDIFEGFNAGDS